MRESDELLLLILSIVLGVPYLFVALFAVGVLLSALFTLPAAKNELVVAILGSLACIVGGLLWPVVFLGDLIVVNYLCTKGKTCCGLSCVKCCDLAESQGGGSAERERLALSTSSLRLRIWSCHHIRRQLRGRFMRGRRGWYGMEWSSGGSSSLIARSCHV